MFFRKIRVKQNSHGKESKIYILIDQKRKLLKQKVISKEYLETISKIEEELINECEDKEFDKLTKSLGQLEAETGGTNFTNVWKQMGKSFPKKSKPLPTGIKNISGKIITNPEEKKKVTNTSPASSIPSIILLGAAQTSPSNECHGGAFLKVCQSVPAMILQNGQHMH